MAKFPFHVRETSNDLMVNSKLLVALGTISVLGLAVAGCQKPAPPSPAQLETKATPPPKLADVKIDAGVPLVVPPDGKRWKNLIDAHTFVPRKDPFALTSIEQGFEFRQEAERLVLTQNGFADNIGVSMPVATGNVIFEPQPYRRLAGVITGNSVLAIIDMGNGRPAEIVRPGQRIAGTPWTVVSIDQDKAVLRRGGNVLPREVVVRLESSPGGSTGSLTPATTGGGARQPVPGTPPPNPGGGRFGGGS